MVSSLKRYRIMRMGQPTAMAYGGMSFDTTAPAPMIDGPYLVEGAKRENQLPWLGDSSITECRGWGGRMRAVNPAVRGGIVINGGMMDVNRGWMGAGSTRIPQECLEKAVGDGHELEWT